MQHPSTKAAFLKYFEGDETAVDSLIENIMFHVADKTCLHVSRLYVSNRKLNSCDIREILRNAYSPDNLDIRLSIPTTPAKETDSKFKQLYQRMQLKARNLAENQLDLFNIYLTM